MQKRKKIATSVSFHFPDENTKNNDVQYYYESQKRYFY